MKRYVNGKIIEIAKEDCAKQRERFANRLSRKNNKEDKTAILEEKIAQLTLKIEELKSTKE